jgi:anti-sigma factor RsiW
VVRQDQEHATLEQLSAYLDGALSPAEQAFCDAHLPHCEECRNRLAALRETVNLLRALPRAEPARSFALTPELLSSSGAATLASAGELPGQVESARPLQRPTAVEERPALPLRRRSPLLSSPLRTTLRALSAIAAVLALLLLFSAIYSASSYQFIHGTSMESAAAPSPGATSRQDQRQTPQGQSASGSAVQPSSSKSGHLTPTAPPEPTFSQQAQDPIAFLIRLAPGGGLLLVSIAGLLLTRRPRRHPS